MKTIMNTVATAPSANAIGMPENITSSVTPPKSRPSDSDAHAVRLPAADVPTICSSSCRPSSVMPTAISE